MFSFFRKKPLKSLATLPKFWIDYSTAFKVTEETTQESEFVVLDTETTGFDYEKDRILCIGALKLKNQNILIKDSFEIFINQEHYNKESATIHGILKNEKVEKISELEALEAFINYLGNRVIVAHHTRFDLTMINKALERNGLPKLLNTHVDTLSLYKKSLIKSPLVERKEHYSLDELADKFNISKKDRHTALGDAYITALLFLKIIKKIKEKKGQVPFKKLL